MTIKQLAVHATDKTNFTTLQGFLNFCQRYLEFVATAGNLQAVIVSQNENHYRFWQYGKAGNYQITRPINSQLMYQAGEFDAIQKIFLPTLQTLRHKNADAALRIQLNNTIYTIQQSIGAALDALPVGQSNKARKINGTLFENFIRLILIEIGVDATSGIVKVPVVDNGRSSLK